MAHTVQYQILELKKVEGEKAEQFKKEQIEKETNKILVKQSADYQTLEEKWQKIFSEEKKKRALETEK